MTGLEHPSAPSYHLSSESHCLIMAPRDLTRTLQRSLEHLRAPRRAGGQHAATMPTHFRPTPAFVQQKDRIAYWHIAPGDRVTVIKGGEQVKGRSGIVDRVERESNRVYLKEPEFSVSITSCSPADMTSLIRCCLSLRSRNGSRRNIPEKPFLPILHRDHKTLHFTRLVHSTSPTCDCK